MTKLDELASDSSEQPEPVAPIKPVVQSLKILQGERFIPSILFGTRQGQPKYINQPIYQVFKNVCSDIGQNRRLRLAAKLTDHLRMMIYRFVSADDTISKLALMAKRERTLLEKSKIARQIKVYEVNIPERHWLKPRAIPAYNLKVVNQITFNIKIQSTSVTKKTKVHDKIVELICSLPIEFDKSRINLDLY